MPNLLTSGLAYNPYFYANEALRILYKRLGMAFYVNRDLERDKGSAKGDTVQVRRAQTFTAVNMPIAEAGIADVNPTYDNLVISQWMGQGFKLTDKEKTLTPERFIAEHITPVAASIADQIDQNLASLALECPWIVAASASPNQTDDFANIRQTLFNNKAPIVNPAEYAYMTDGVLQNRYEKAGTFVQAMSDAGAGELQRSGQLGVKFGFRIFPNQNAPTYTSGVGALTTPTTSGAQNAGATTLVVAGTAPSGTYKRGTVITITGDPQLYAVKADVAAALTTTFSISPALAQNVNNGVVVSFNQTTTASIGLAFHKDAFALVMQPLEDPGPGIISATVVDPITQLTLRSRIWGSGGAGATFWTVDALWGYKTLNPNLATRVQI